MTRTAGRRDTLPAMRILALAALACHPEPDPTDTGTAGTGFEPAAIGFGFDGVVQPDGSLTGYTLDGQARDPVMVIVFGSDAYFLGGDPDTESCVALGRFDPAPRAEDLPTVDGDPLFSSYDAALTLEAHSCRGRVAPGWGPDGQDLWGPFDGAHLGLGFGPMTDYLRDGWSTESLDRFGGAMLAEWIALNDLDGAWVGADWTTGIAFAVDPETDEVVLEEGPDGPVLVPEDLSQVAPGDVLPPFYVRSYPIWYQELALVDLEHLQ
ncbi:MAG: hypothetical protein R3F59_30520 [Myxococcota bacterium]